jgi:hypothetical protein
MKNIGPLKLLMQTNNYKTLKYSNLSVIIEGDSSTLTNAKIHSIVPTMIENTCARSTLRYKNIFDDKKPTSFLNTQSLGINKEGTIHFYYKGAIYGDSSGPTPPPSPPATKKCWRDAKNLYNNLSRPVTVGFWGACSTQGGGCSSRNQGNAHNFTAIDPIWDVVILSFIEWCSDPVTPGDKCELQPNVATSNIYLALTDRDDFNVTEIKARQNTDSPRNKFVLASLGGYGNSINGPDDDDDDDYETWAENIFNSWVKIATHYHLDGIDIDVEAELNSTAYALFLKKVSNAGWIVSCSPQFSQYIIGISNTAWAQDIRNWNNIAKTPLPLTGIFQAYNFLLTPDMINYVDIINLQLYNSNLRYDKKDKLFWENSMYAWLTCFAIWCQREHTNTDSLADYHNMINPTTSTSKCIKQTKPPNGYIISLTPKDIQKKFIMGFCGKDCDPTYLPPEATIKNFLPYFRGVMIWAIDEPMYNNKDETTTEYLRRLKLPPHS